MKTFLNDGKITKDDFEKFLTGGLFAITVLIVMWKYLVKDFVDPNIVYFSLGIGSLFVLRKTASYFKSDSYYSKGGTNTYVPDIANEPMADQNYGYVNNSDQNLKSNTGY